MRNIINYGTLSALFLFTSSLALANTYAPITDGAKVSAEDRAEIALTEAIHHVRVRSADGQRDSTATQLARNYAKRLAAQGYLDGHAGFQARSAQLGGYASEVIAQTYNSTPTAAAAQCVSSWLNSRPHYAIMVPFHRRYAYAMERGRNGYFCVGLFAD